MTNSEDSLQTIISEHRSTITVDFQQTVETALKHYSEPDWLGQKSLLAAPYLLGSHLSLREDRLPPSAGERGRLLQRLLRESARELSAQTELEQRQQQILQLRYLTTSPLPVSGEQGLLKRLNITRNTYNLHKNVAIQRMAQALIQKLTPALRLETVPTPRNVLGRQEEITTLTAWLQERRSVSIVGPSGVGKTTLARAAIHRLGTTAPFWLTMRTGFNDRLHSIIFYLAHYLQRHGQPALLAQLLTDESELRDYPAAFGLLAAGLEAIATKKPLLCFDEVEQIQPQTREPHEQISKFWQDLQTVAPLLVLGQTLPFLTQKTMSIGGLSEASVSDYLVAETIPIKPDELDNLMRNTNGYPLLLDLFVAYYRSLQRRGEQLETDAARVQDHGQQRLNAGSFVELALRSFATERSLEVWVNRIVQQLQPQELSLLRLLAIFRNPVPTDIEPVPGTQELLREWVHWHLLQSDANGGIELIPAFRQAMNTQLRAAEKEQLHLQAAQIRADYGQFTAAAYHFVHAGEAEIAVALWAQHQQMEIEQGQAGAALAMLSMISERQLSPEGADLLCLHRAALNRLLGNYEPALTDLERTTWHAEQQRAEAIRMAADIAELRGNMRRAIEGYYRAQQTLEQQLSARSQIHRDLGYAFLHQHQYADAHQMLLRIRHDAANLEGFIHEREGRLPEAKQAYEQALHDAEAGAYAYGAANAQMNIGCIYGWQGNAAQAEMYLKQAIAYFEQSNMLNKLGEGLVNLAVAYLVSEAYDQALPHAQTAVTLFETINVQRGKAAAYQLMAEAYLGRGELTAAEQFANQALAIDNTTIQPDSLRVLGEIRLQQGDVAAAEELICRSLTLLAENPYPILEAYAYWALSKVYQQQGHVDEAQQTVMKAARLFHSIGVTHRSIQAVALSDMRNSSLHEQK